MKGGKHPLVWAYEVGALDGGLNAYIKHCIRAITAESEQSAHMYLDFAKEKEAMLSPELIEIGRFVVESVLGINRNGEVKHDALEA